MAAQKKYELRSPVGPNDVIFKKGDTERVVNLREFFGQEWQEQAQGQPPKLTSFNGEEIVTSMLQVLSQEKPVVLGFTAGHDEASADEGTEPAEWGAFAHEILQKREGYKVRTFALSAGAEVPKDIDVVVIAGPKKDFNDGEVMSLKLLLQRGGRILVTLDSGAEMNDRPLPNFFKFLGEVGVQPQTNIVLDPENAVDVGSKNQGGGMVIAKDKASFSLSGFDKKHPVTAKFDVDKRIYVIGACGLESKPETVPEGVKVTELARSGSDGWGEMDFPRNQEFTADRDTPGPIPLAYAVEGHLKGASGDDMRVVVLGDTTALANGAPPEVRSPDLALNSIRWLAKQEWLIHVDKKRQEDRSLVLNDSQSSYVFRVCVLFLPLLAMAFGMTMFLTRRSQ